MDRVILEPIKHPEHYDGQPLLTKTYCEQAMQYVLQKIDANLNTFIDLFPAPASENNVYPAIENKDWTTAFWPGMLWLAYELTGDEKYRQLAEHHIKSFQKRLDDGIHIHTHDLGFLYTLSGIAPYKLTGNPAVKNMALQAADLLMRRYFDKAGIIQAWGNLDDPNQRGRIIVDCLMNLPLLYWATEMTGDRKYYDAALSHAHQSAAYLVRNDASTFHTFYMDVETGAPKYGRTAQGYSDTSCWARGQAWAMYGLPLSYTYTNEWIFIEIAQKLTHYFLNRLPEDRICYWDLSFISGPEERDSSGAAIAACGMLELSKHLPLTDKHKRLYENAAMQIVRSLVENYTTANHPHSNGVLLHAVYGKPQGHGIDECCIWGDYYYFEALVRLIKDWNLYW